MALQLDFGLQESFNKLIRNKLVPEKDLLEFISHIRYPQGMEWLSDYYHAQLNSNLKPMASVDVVVKSDELPLDFDETSENLRVG